MKLPFSYIRLNSNFGLILRRTRIMRRLKQAVVADDAGISRSTLSRIERGRVPRRQVLDKLLAILDLDWPVVAKRANVANIRPILDGPRVENLFKIGSDLQLRRKKQGKTLATLSANLGLSASTLSRLERGELPRSRVFQDLAGYESEEFSDRPFMIKHEKLAAFLE